MESFISQIASKDSIELLSKFFDSANEAVKRAHYNAEILEAFDLIQAISCYRYFPSVESCIEAFPSLAPDRHKVEYIWEQFSKLSPLELSDVYIASINKLELSDCTH